MKSDCELLRRYAETGSEEDFTELVRRHLNLVYSAALRQVNGDWHLAQDVTQAVFADLARKAASLSNRSLLTGWLYTSTHFASAKVARSESRRRAREQQAHAMHQQNSEPPLEPDWQKLCPALDSLMHELRESDRDAILQRYFENRPLAEIGRNRGLSEDAARKRVDRALEQLRNLFARRGIHTVAALASVISANAIQTAPASLAAAIAGGSLAGISAGTASTFSLVKLITMNKFATAFAGAVLVVSVATPMAIQRHNQAKLREENKSLHRQVDHLTPLLAENQRLSNLVAQSAQMSDQLGELLKLRGEVTMLRAQTNEIAKLQEDNSRLRAALTSTNSKPTPRETEEEQKKQAIAKLNDSRSIMLALIQYADKHGNRFPTNVDQINNYLQDSNPPLTQTNEFDVMYEGPLNQIANPSSAIVLRENQPWQTGRGTWARSYGFADGHSEVHVSTTGNFDEWEKQHEPVLRPDTGQ